MIDYAVKTIGGENRLVTKISPPELKHDTYFSELECYVENDELVLTDSFRFMHRRSIYHVPAGVRIKLSKYINFLPKILLKDRLLRTILCFSYCRDTLQIYSTNLKKEVKSLLREDGFGKFTSFILSWFFYYV